MSIYAASISTVSPVSAVSTQTPTSKNGGTNNEFDIDFQPAKKIRSVLKKVGFQNASKIIHTLQGSIWRAENKNEFGQSVVIKVTDIQMHKESRAIIKGQTHVVLEDIMMEQSILKLLSQQGDCPDSIVKFVKFFKSHSSLYLVQEDGGSSLFDFVETAHRLVATGQIDINHWKEVVYIIFTQMVEAIEYIHSLNIAHFDISLENWLINDVAVETEEANGKYKKVRFVLGDIQIKLCDFGLAQMFMANEHGQCLSNKYCGKEAYKSAEVISRKQVFDAKANDIWCLGVCLFMLNFGIPPWDVAAMSDTNFDYVQQFSVIQMLEFWKMDSMIDPKTIYLFSAIFVGEKRRINIHQIQNYLNQ